MVLLSLLTGHDAGSYVPNLGKLTAIELKDVLGSLKQEASRRCVFLSLFLDLISASVATLRSWSPFWIRLFPMIATALSQKS